MQGTWDRLKTLWIVALAVTGSALVSGCGPYRASHVDPDGVYASERVILLDRDLDPWILPERVKVIEARLEEGEGGFPQVRLELANRRSKPTSMELRTVFRDRDGLPVHTSAWKPAVVPGNATYSYTAVSTSKEAKDFQVQVKTLEP